MKYKLYIFVRRLLVAVACLVPLPAMSVTPEPLVILNASQTTSEYTETLDAFQTALQQHIPKTQFSPLEAVALGATPSLVFTLGEAALVQAKQKFPSSPVLASMLFEKNKKVLVDDDKTVKVFLKESVADQLRSHRRILPNVKRIGVLFDPKLNTEWVQEAKRAAKLQGVEIIALEVRSALEIPAALKSLKRRADSIMAIHDKTIYSGKTARAILLFTFRNRIPFVGLSKAWVKAGALYALDWDYQALGIQCAELAENILENNDAPETIIHSSTKSSYALNLKTARHMNISIQEDIVGAAAKVYE